MAVPPYIHDSVNIDTDKQQSGDANRVQVKRRNMYSCNLIVLFSLLLPLVVCHPTRYKINNNDKLEPDLIPVSSTVIPLPIYRVETSFNASAGKSSLVKPDGPVTLLTVHGNKSLPSGKETKVTGKDSEKHH